jgi:hypothetical protein
MSAILNVLAGRDIYHGVLVAGIVSTGIVDRIGYDSGVMGTLSPSTIRPSRSIEDLYDNVRVVAPLDSHVVFTISGLATDPGAGYVRYVRVGNIITPANSGNSFSYQYSIGGQAGVWRWGRDATLMPSGTNFTFGLVNGQTYIVEVALTA